MKAPIVIKIKSLPFLTSLVVAGIFLTTGRALANTELWNATNNVSATTNWSDNANWINIQGTGNPGPAGNDVVFGDKDLSGLGVINSVVDANLLNPNSMVFTNNSANGNFYTILIPSGIAVTNANAFNVGIRASTANSYQTTVGFVGGGTLVQNGAMTIENTTTVGGSGQLPWLDLSGLTNFIMNNAAAIITVGGVTNNNEPRGSGRLDLGQTNVITAAAINVALGTGNGGIGGTINLGAGSNVLNVGSINLAGGKVNNATVKYLASTGGLRLRGVTGADTDRNVGLNLGARTSTGSGKAIGTVDLTGGHPADIKASVATLGRSTSTDQGVGNLGFDTGTIDITTINMGVSTSTGGATGNLTNNGGFLIVSNLSLANQTGTTIAGAGNLYINGTGVVIVSNNIVKTTTAGVGSIIMANGSLIVGTNIGASANIIDNLTVADSALTLPAALTPSAYFLNITATGTSNAISISTLPTVSTYPAQFPIISYVNALGDNNTFFLGTLPGIFKGYISNNLGSLTLDLVITNGPFIAPAKSITWNGTPTGDWTTNTATLNWLTNGTSVSYNQGDTVTFDDTLAGTTNVNLAAILAPANLIVNNSAANYLFSGTGKITGSTGLTKTGTGTLILDNSSANDFVGAVSIGSGSTVQVGNNDINGSLPTSASWDDEGTLVFNRSNNLTVSTVISGAGSLVQNGTGRLSLNGANTYSGSTLVRNGTLTLTASGSIGNSAQINVQNGTFDVSATPPSTGFSPIGISGSTLILDTNNISTSALSVTNSIIRVVANGAGPSIITTSLTVGGATNYINLIGVANVSSPGPIPIISYNSATIAGAFNIGLTNFPNAYVTNDTTANAIEIVFLATPYVVTWNGGSAVGNNWSDSNNWSGVSISANDSLFFDGSARLTPVNDTATGTTYSNITLNSGASPFTLTGNAITLGGNIVNNSPNTQTVLLGMTFSNSVSLNGTAAPLVVGGGLTNTAGPGRYTTNLLTGTGVLTNLFANVGNATNLLRINDAAANWTLMDNASSTTSSVPWALALDSGTLNFGTATSAPKLVSTSAQGVPQDNQMGIVSDSISVLNFSNGTYTTTARFNTGTAPGAISTVNQYGGIFTIGSQFQGANQTGGSSFVNLFAGTMNIGSVTNPTGQFYIASRGAGVLTITNSAVLNCGILDVSRSINSGIPGTVNLDGGTIIASSVGTATANGVATTTGSTATFNFNGGTLKARASSATFFQGRTTVPVVPITAIVTARGAIIDSDTNTISILEPLLTDPNLAGAADGGLTKLGNGTLTLTATNTYIGDTLVNAGTLLVNGIQGQSRVIVSSSATLGGNGFIGSNVTVNAGGTLSPGTANIGVLTVAGDVTLAGATTVKIDKNAGTTDLLLATNSTPSTITYGGTLNVVTLTGSLAPGDTFKFFSASNYVGSFATINPPNVTWNTSNLNVDGTLTVVSVAPTGPTTNATITTITLSGTNLLVHGTNNNVPNNLLHYVVLTSTNLQTPLINWTPVVTNIYNNNGTFDFTNPVVPGTANQFIDVKAVP